MARPAVFLDRDGTIIVDKAYLDNVEGVELLPGAAAGLRRMADLGYALVLVTNQSGIGRGYFEPCVVDQQYERLQQLLHPHGVELAAMKMCPHAPDEGCDCRKPAPAMLLEAAKELDIDLKRSWMIGDKQADVQAGEAAGCQALRIGDDDSPGTVRDLCEAARIIAARS